MAGFVGSSASPRRRYHRRIPLVVKGTADDELVTEPQLVQTAARNVAEIKSAIGAAKAAAAGPTTGVAAAAADEVSAAAAKLFGGYAQEYQAVLSQAAAFHEEFAAALASAGNAYAAAEAANASASRSAST